MDAAEWQQQVGFSRSNIMEEIIASSNTAIRAPTPQQQQQQQPVLDDNSQRRARPHKDQNLNCPRCNSTNTKFCYYNNYSLSQPRYFCKTCRRYWTAGGSLRNVPVGGGSRKNKRPSPSTLITPSSSSSPPPISSLSSATTINNKLIPDLNPPHHHHQISLSNSSKIHPHPHHHGQDLNLAFPTSILQPMELAKGTESNKVDLLPSLSSSPSALELLRTGIVSSSFNSFVPVPMSDSNAVLYPSSGLPCLQELKPSFMGFPGPTDGLGFGPGPGGDGSQGHGGEARLFFPLGDISKFPSHQSAATTTNSPTTATGNEVGNQQSIKGSTLDHQHHQVAGGYWSGMLGGGAW